MKISINAADILRKIVNADGGTVNPVTLIAQSAIGRDSVASTSATLEYVPKPLSITYSVTLTMLCIAKISVTDSNMDNIVLFTECRVSDFWLISHMRLGFLGNQPFSTRFFCSNNSKMLHKHVQPNTPSAGLRITLDTMRLAVMNSTPAMANTHQHFVPK